MKNPIAKYLMCAYAYYELDTPLISDTEFDMLAKEILDNWDNIEHMHKYLLTKDIPDPELLIRTGNTRRLSNFLLWQLAYSEIFFEKKLWPEFTEKDYNKIIKRFKNIKRNFGKI